MPEHSHQPQPDAALLSGQNSSKLVYSSKFNEVVASEWSHTSTDITPSGRNFLGQFGNDTVILTLNNLPPHIEATVSFDLLIIRTWDGNRTAPPHAEPDVWDLSVESGSTLLHTTFSNHPVFKQAYPDQFPGGNYPPCTGASETNTLGYAERWFFNGIPIDSVYKLSFTFAHLENSLKLKFSGIGLGPLDNESWGLDNVVVTVKPNISLEPDPISLVSTLASAGAAVLGGQDPRPLSGVVLGGIEGVKRRLASLGQRITRLKEVAKSGKNSLEQLMSALENESWSVRCAAYSLLLENAEPAFEKALEIYSPYLQLKCLRTFSTNHSGTFYCIAISPDGQTLATNGENNTVKLWDLHTGELKNILGGSSAKIHSLTMSPDGYTLIGEFSDEIIRVWNLETGELTSTLTNQTYSLQCIVLSPNGEILAVVDGSTIELWDVNTGKLINTLPHPQKNSVEQSRHFTQRIAFSPDGQILVSGTRYYNDDGAGTGVLTLWNLHTGEVLLNSRWDAVCGIAFSPDGQTLATGYSSNTISLWNVDFNNQKSLFTRKFRLENNRVDEWSLFFAAFSPDSLTLASNGVEKGTINLWNVGTGKLGTTLERHSGEIHSIAFSPAGQTLVIGRGNTIELWGIGDSTLPKLPPVELLQRYLVLKEALKLGNVDLQRVIQALDDASWQVQKIARLLLKERTEPSVKQALQEHRISYTWLDYLLTAKRWREADEETKVIMQRLAGKEGRLTLEDLKNLPCQDLRTIDQLWTQHSNRYYGFSVQKQKWEEVLRTKDSWSEINCHQISAESELEIRLGWASIDFHHDYHGANDQYQKTVWKESTKGYFPRTDSWAWGSSSIVEKLKECDL